jgi:hypothetical protein
MQKQQKKPSKKLKQVRLSVRESMRLESQHADREQILRHLALPMHERLNFLRVRLPGGGSCL